MLFRSSLEIPVFPISPSYTNPNLANFTFEPYAFPPLRHVIINFGIVSIGASGPFCKNEISISKYYLHLYRDIDFDIANDFIAAKDIAHVILGVIFNSGVSPLT